MSTVAAVELVIVLLIAVSIVALVTSRLKIPYTIALVFAGIGIDLFHIPIMGVIGASGQERLLTPEVIFVLFLPGLLFESAINIDVAHLRENLRPILLLAVAGVALATAITGYAIGTFLGLPLVIAMLFGALISATDPVSVIALFKDLNANKRLAVIVEGESLFNDGTAAVIFQVILAAAVTGQFSLTEGLRHFVTVAIGGAGLGVLVGYAASHITAQVDEPRIEITLTTIVAYGSYLLAESLHVSGVIAVVAAGVTVGNYGALFGMTPRTRVALWSFWEYFAFVINSLVFLLVGIEVHVSEMLGSWRSILLAAAAVLLGRMIAVYGLSPLSALFGQRLRVSWQHVLFWGGLHGSVSIALALSLPVNLPHRAELLTMTFGVVAFSILVQGLTMKPLLRRLNLVEGGGEEFSMLKARQMALAAAGRELSSLAGTHFITPATERALAQELEHERGEIETGIRGMQEDTPGLVDEEVRVARLRLIHAEQSAIQRAAIEGAVPANVAEHLLAGAAERIQKLTRS